MPGRKVWTRETLTSTDLQDFIQDQVVMRFPSAAARDAAIPVGARKAGMVTWLDAPGELQVYQAGAWQRLAPGVWVDLSRTTGQTSGIPVTGTPQTVQFSSTSLVVPAGRSLELDYHVPNFELGAGTNCYVRMIMGAVVVAGNSYSTGSVGSLGPLHLNDSVVGTGASVAVAIQAWCASGAATIRSDSTSGSPVTLRYRIV